MDSRVGAPAKVPETSLAGLRNAKIGTRKGTELFLSREIAMRPADPILLDPSVAIIETNLDTEQSKCDSLWNYMT